MVRASRVQKKNLDEDLPGQPVVHELLEETGGLICGCQEPPREDSANDVLRSIRGYPGKDVVVQDPVHEVPDLFAGSLLAVT